MLLSSSAEHEVTEHVIHRTLTNPESGSPRGRAEEKEEKEEKEEESYDEEKEESEEEEKEEEEEEDEGSGRGLIF